jgi:hypothetical protein
MEPTSRPTPPPITVEEFERVLRSERFATVHDLVGAAGFADLTEGSRPSEASDATGEQPLPTLPTRRS